MDKFRVYHFSLLALKFWKNTTFTFITPLNCNKILRHNLGCYKSSLLLNLDLEIKDVSDVTTLVVGETESEKELSQEVKSILEFVDVILK